jgi:hypothetical protein
MELASMAPADTDNEVLKAYLSNNKVSPKELPAVIAMFASLSSAPKTSAKDSTAISTPKAAAPAPVAPVKTQASSGCRCRQGSDEEGRGAGEAQEALGQGRGQGQEGSCR